MEGLIRKISELFYLCEAGGGYFKARVKYESILRKSWGPYILLLLHSGSFLFSQFRRRHAETILRISCKVF